MKKRVRCANCGMIYDAYITADDMGFMPYDDKCPKCGSNAKDDVNYFKYTITTEENK